MIQAAASGQGVALGRFPLTQQMIRDKRLVAPFGKAIASPRAYYVIRSSRTAGKHDVGDFAAWLLEEAGRDALLAAPGRTAAKNKR